MLRWLGASIAYWFWLVVPIGAAASVLPAREALVLIQPTVRLVAEEGLAAGDAAAPALPTAAVAEGATTPMALLPAPADLLVAVWLLGAGALLVLSLVTTRRLASDPSIGPALVGVLRPRIVLPTDFTTRFDAEERVLILAHEEVHRLSRHTLVNACDAAVIATCPWRARRAYAQALLEAQTTPTFVRLGWTWTNRSGKRLGTRIEMLGHPSSA